MQSLRGLSGSRVGIQHSAPRSRPGARVWKVMAANVDIARLDCGKRLSEAVVHGKTVYLAGQVSWVCRPFGILY